MSSSKSDSKESRESKESTNSEEEFMILDMTMGDYEEYLKKALFDNLLEFEVIYGNTLKKDSKKINKEIFLRLMRGFNDSLDYINLGESSSLDIRTEYKYKGKSALSNIRATVNGLSNIKQYCLSDSLEGLNTEFLKKNIYKDPLQ